MVCCECCKGSGKVAGETFLSWKVCPKCNGRGGFSERPHSYSGCLVMLLVYGAGIAGVITVLCLA